MKTPSSYSILDAVKNLSRLDESLWKALIVENRPNLSVIPAPASYSRWDHPDENQFKTSAAVYAYRSTTGLSLISDAALTLLLPQSWKRSTNCSSSPPWKWSPLHGLKTIVHGLFDQGEKLQLVLNRTPKLMDISTQELEKILGRSLYAALPNDYMGLYQSYSSGNLLNSNTRLAQHFGLLASKIAGLPPAKAKKKFALFG